MNTEKKKTKVDLVTGFLGAGKTTFIKKYLRRMMRISSAVRTR